MSKQTSSVSPASLYTMERPKPSKAKRVSPAHRAYAYAICLGRAQANITKGWGIWSEASADYAQFLLDWPSFVHAITREVYIRTYMGAPQWVQIQLLPNFPGHTRICR